MKGVSLYNFKLFPLIIICSNGVLTTVTMNKISNLFTFPYTIGSASIMHKLVEEEDSFNCFYHMAKCKAMDYTYAFKMFRV